MKGSNRRAEGFDLENLREQITRRRLLFGTAAVGGGWLLTNDSTREDHLTQAEDRFVELAGTLNNADLVDPRQSSIHQEEVENAINYVSDILDEDLPDNSQTDRRVSALNAALGYYSQLANTLDAGTSLRRVLTDSEYVVLYHNGTLENDPEDMYETDSFRNSIIKLSENEQNPEIVMSEEGKLVPNQQEIVDSLRTQRGVFDKHLTAQQMYLDSASAIKTSIRALEESQFEAARSTLTQAHESITTVISNLSDSYRLSASGLSLNQYTALLNLRKEGISELLDVSESSVTEQRRQTATNSALDLFFESRRIIIN